MIKNVDVTVGVNKKLIPKFKGPYVVKKMLDYDRYVVGDIEGNQVTQRPYEGIVGPDQMKSWVKMSNITKKKNVSYFDLTYMYDYVKKKN